MEPNYCKYCEKSFVFKDIYEQHLLTCNFFHKKQKNQDRQKDLKNENIPSTQDLYKLIQFLALKCDKLEKDVQKMKKLSNTKCKNDLLHLLHLNTPSASFKEWLTSLQITKLELEEVFQFNLTQGIKYLLECQLKKEMLNFPLCAFKQKPNTLFVYVGNDPPTTPSTTTPPTSTTTIKPTKKKETQLFKNIVSSNHQKKWMIMPNEQFEMMINKIIHKFIIEFSSWQEKNEHTFKENEKDKYFNYMLKIHNMKVNETQQKNEIKKWLIAKLEKNSLSFYDENMTQDDEDENDG